MPKQITPGIHRELVAVVPGPPDRRDGAGVEQKYASTVPLDPEPHAGEEDRDKDHPDDREYPYDWHLISLPVQRCCWRIRRIL